MDLPERDLARSYKASRLPWRRGWEWAELEGYIYSDDYDEYCFEVRSTSRPSTTTTWGKSAEEVLADRSPGQYSCRCPAHDDGQASLRVLVLPEGKVLMKCWAGCETQDVLSSMGLGWKDLE